MFSLDDQSHIMTALHFCEQPAIKTFYDLKRRFNIHDFLTFIRKKPALIEHIKRAQKKKNWRGVEQTLRWAASCEKNHIIDYFSPIFPQSLRVISHPPLALFVRGDSTILNRRCVGIVGSRNASSLSCHFAEKIAALLSSHHVTIVSGLAIGVDRFAHQGAMRIKSGRTIGVLPSGINIPYPKRHEKLIANMFPFDLLLSELPCGFGIRKDSFSRRNRIISALSEHVVIIDAGMKSGSMITAKYAIEQSKDLWAVPGSILDLRKKGCHALIKQGAFLLDDPTDLLMAMGIEKQNKKKEEAPEIMDKLPNGFFKIDDIYSTIGLPMKDLLATLSILESSGWIVHHSGGYYKRGQKR